MCVKKISAQSDDALGGYECEYHARYSLLFSLLTSHPSYGDSHGDSHRIPMGMGWEWKRKFHSHGNRGKYGTT